MKLGSAFFFFLKPPLAFLPHAKGDTSLATLGFLQL